MHEFLVARIVVYLSIGDTLAELKDCFSTTAAAWVLLKTFCGTTGLPAVVLSKLGLPSVFPPGRFSFSLSNHYP